ncbi:MAG: hypothetical protein R2720_01380 [Candidatus Nanopelagicales bacterium]
MSDDTAAQDEVRRLQAEVTRLQRELEQSPPKQKRRWVRTFWSTVLIVVACLLAPLSVVSVWARGEVTDTNRYVQTVAPLASDPAIQDAITTRITDEIFKYVDVPTLTSDAVASISQNRDLNPRQTAALQALTGPINSGIESYTEDAVAAVVGSDQFESAWVEANTLAHQRLQQALSGQNTDNAIRVADNQVVLDLGNLIDQVKQLLISKGFTVADKIPTVDQTIVLFEAPNATAMQTAYSALNTLGFWLPLIAITLAVVGVFVSHTRSTALAWFGFGLTAAMAVGAGMLGFARIEYLNSLPVSVNHAAATAFFDTFTDFLRQSLWAGAAAGIVLLLGGLVLGAGKVATGVRSVPVKAAAAVQSWLASLGLAMDGARRWVAAQATGLRIAASLAALVFVMLQRYKTPDLILWTTAVLLVVLFVIQVFASGDDESVSPTRGDSAGTPVAAD